MFSPKTAAARLGLTEDRVRKLIRAKKLKATNIGNPNRPLYVIEESELQRFAALDRPGHRPRKGRGDQ